MSMMEKIREEIERIRRETEQYKPSNEAHTCDIVIKPLIYACGYSPYEVVPQAADAVGGRPDYTVMPNTDYRWYLEAKDWSAALKSDNAVQALNYANQNGGRWVVLTNGREWRLYDNSIMGVTEDKEVYVAKIDNTDDLADLLAALSKESVMNGGLESFVRNARIKKVLDKELKNENSEVIKSVVKTLKKMDGLSGVKPADVADYFRSVLCGSIKPSDSVFAEPTKGIASRAELEAGIFNLIELEAKKEGLRHSEPAVVYFPDGSSAHTSSWKDAAIQIVRYVLNREGTPHLPYKPRGEGGFRCFLNDKPVHPNEERMIGKYGEIEISGRKVYIDTHRGSDGLVKRLVALCSDMGLPPESFRIEVGFVEKKE